MSSSKSALIPYVLFAFVLGFAWFMLAPMVPSLTNELHASLSSILLFISFYGYAMVIGSIPAGLWTAHKGPRPVLTCAVVLSVVGLFLRIFAHTYAFFFVAQAIASLAYPFLIAPIGSILRMSNIRNLKMSTGFTIGMLFFGMGLSAIIASHFTMTTGLWLGFILNLIVGIWLLVALRGIPRPDVTTFVRLRMTYSNWWIIGLVVSSTSVMIGGVTTSALGHLQMPNAVALGGLLSGLTFLGSAVGAALFGFLGEAITNAGPLIRILSILTLVSVLLVTLLVTGHLGHSEGMFDIMFFLAGMFGNGWYTLTLEEAARRAADNGSAGLNTAGYSMASNLGVAIIPVVLGPLVISQPSLWIAITLVLFVVAVVLSLVTRVQTRLTTGS
ncbi:MFS transporter [Alicyclobacillus fastidiosus]|uniref:MFS transporter n=1 Tax=Alicyclobacillus fastidiosus TaxID=392011 RepID=A0ABY6ZCQ2_9BACL|nr:MFS transporter [Alicyclobacillus fastidiosus]WAH40622.1 MFS transporter [Alicyclobacillus fastidiosus]